MNDFIYGVCRIGESKPFIIFTTFEDANNFANLNRNIDSLVVVKLEKEGWALCVEEYKEKKINKGLEALKYLKENKRKHWLENDKSNECLDIIEEELKAGVMHICPKDSDHTIINTGDDDLVMLTIVVAK